VASAAMPMLVLVLVLVPVVVVVVVVVVVPAQALVECRASRAVASAASSVAHLVPVCSVASLDAWFETSARRLDCHRPCSRSLHKHLTRLWCRNVILLTVVTLALRRSVTSRSGSRRRR
jgi:hypothetical protein